MNAPNMKAESGIMHGNRSVLNKKKRIVVAIRF
jgi:hypothetical protein